MVNPVTIDGIEKSDVRTQLLECKQISQVLCHLYAGAIDIFSKHTNLRVL